ncbi:MAG TPA: hypothetical protein PKE20_00655 [Promineifilum sp.]|nr:hypothetical protein [Promineifilum sp.]
MRDAQITNPYRLTVTLYYSWPDRERIEIERRDFTFEVDQPGEQIFKFDA